MQQSIYIVLCCSVESGAVAEQLMCRSRDQHLPSSIHGLGIGALTGDLPTIISVDLYVFMDVCATMQNFSIVR